MFAQYFLFVLNFIHTFAKTKLLMDGIIMAAQLILGLSILVGVHELGHFLPAKLFKMKVDKFYLFFDAFGRKLFSKKIGETEYGIGWLPLGGYVKISGMIDESLDLETMKQAPKPWEFRSKPAWQRLIVMIGGVSVNVIVGILIFIGITFFVGESYLPASEAKFGIVAHELAQKIGLQTGDKIIKVNGKEVNAFNDIYSPDAFLESNSSYTVDRNGEIINISIPNNFVDNFSRRKSQAQFIDPIVPFKVGKVLPSTPAELAGLQTGDLILKVDTIKIQFFHELQAALLAYKSKPIDILIDRNGEQKVLTASVDENGKLGFQVDWLLEYKNQKFGLGESVVKGTAMAFNVVTMQLKGFKKMFSGEIDVSKSLSGPIGIAKEFGGTWDWLRFWTLTGLLSMVLAFMNILPIPALDGGHVILLTYEIITRRKPSDKFLEITQKIGIAILGSLMIYSVLNDVIRLF